ncbi:MAG: polysaccharide pyruvyl transferase family protein [Coriobacteriales bacterium]|jgi:polysaccharide pyruvyl transferase WcaK-like protein
MPSKYNILLITNRDSDNCGDQIIEQTDISLVKAVMKNLGVPNNSFHISSRAGGIISKKYLRTRDPELLGSAQKAISECDMVLVGGAPMFNYLYQNLYERTAKIVEIAQSYEKPVVFSAIGIESYDDNNKKCQRLKTALNLPCVKQITTRDNMDALQRYKTREDLTIAHVADPAVFTDSVFENLLSSNKAPRKKKLIGIFVLRAKGFSDNKVPVSGKDFAKLCIDLGTELEARGYDYRFVSSGHFSDEAFLKRLKTDYGIPSNKLIFNMNTPEQLVSTIAGFDGVISTRLHPSIVSYSLDVPSVGLAWNPKVKGFYSSINYPDRVITSAEFDAQIIIDRLELAMSQGIQKSSEFQYSIYQYLYAGISSALNIDTAEHQIYSYDQLKKELPRFKGTSEKEEQKKIQRKLERSYENYNKLEDACDVAKGKAPNSNIKQGYVKRALRDLDSLLKRKREWFILDTFITAIFTICFIVRSAHGITTASWTGLCFVWFSFLLLGAVSAYYRRAGSRSNDFDTRVGAFSVFTYITGYYLVELAVALFILVLQPENLFACLVIQLVLATAACIVLVANRLQNK